ncbi:MAG: hypothetical protein WBC06_08835 [Chitinophagaceae bacterium]
MKFISLASAALPLSAWATNEKGEKIILPDNPKHRKLKKPVTAITLGAGTRSMCIEIMPFSIPTS